jgi:hypothetical protein
MVGMALDKLEEGGKVKLDEERKASMVSNLYCSCFDKDAQPIVNIERRTSSHVAEKPNKSFLLRTTRYRALWSAGLVRVAKFEWSD